LIFSCKDSRIICSCLTEKVEAKQDAKTAPVFTNVKRFIYFGNQCFMLKNKTRYNNVMLVIQKYF